MKRRHVGYCYKVGQKLNMVSGDYVSLNKIIQRYKTDKYFKFYGII
jgi:hypothetical protein